jgi:hypothetical protein
VFVHSWIVIEVEANGTIRVPGNVVLGGIFPPMVECAVVLRVEDLVVEPQTEARSTQSIGQIFVFSQWQPI